MASRSESYTSEPPQLRSKLKMYDSEYASLQELDEDISSADAAVDGELGSAHKRLNDIHLNSERFKVLIEEVRGSESESASSEVVDGNRRLFRVFRTALSNLTPTPPTRRSSRRTPSPPPW